MMKKSFKTSRIFTVLGAFFFLISCQTTSNNSEVGIQAAAARYAEGKDLTREAADLRSQMRDAQTNQNPEKVREAQIKLSQVLYRMESLKRRNEKVARPQKTEGQALALNSQMYSSRMGDFTQSRSLQSGALTTSQKMLRGITD